MENRNYPDFQRISRRVMDLVMKGPEEVSPIQDEVSLVKVACSLLNADAAVLLRRKLDGPQESAGSVLQVYPKAYESWKNSRPLDLWYWYAFTTIPDIEGFSKEDSFKIENQQFSMALVAFGKNDIAENSRLELILLKISPEAEPYSSYHTWAAYNLLSKYFSVLKNIKLTQLEMESKRQYARFAKYEVLPHEKWADINKKTEELIDLNCVNRWLLIAIWTSFQVGQKYSGEDSNAEIQQMIEALEKEDCKGIGPYKDVIRFMLKPNSMDTLLKYYSDNPDTINKIVSGKKDEKKTADEARVQIAVLFLKHAWWAVLRQAIEPDNNIYKDLLKKFVDDCAGTAMEGEKQVSSQKAILTVRNVETEDLSKKVKTLLSFTRFMLISILGSDLYKDETKELSEWGRQALRLYFALVLSEKGSNLEQRYLGGEKHQDHKSAPNWLRREFIVNLSRFMLGSVNILQERLEMNPQPKVVTGPEEMDSLLYLVDQYARVVLEVDARLNIRELLAKQVAAEVYHHLSRPNYRDHLLHVIDVFLLGHLILHTRISWIQMVEKPFVQHLCAMAPKNKDNKSFLTREDEWLRNWTVASLLHDIGFQVGHQQNLATSPEVWKEFFNLKTSDGQDWLKFRWDETSRGDEFLATLTMAIHKSSPLCAKMLPDDAKCLKDHGMLSALRIAQVLLHADNQGVDVYGTPNTGLISQYHHAIHAVAFHNLHGRKVSMEDNPLGCLLRLCDELQEWDRRRVNIEKILKNLYLDIQGRDSEDILGPDILETFYANVLLSAEDSKGEYVLKTPNRQPPTHRFRFLLRYKDSVQASFDPTLTLLGKAFNFQNLDLSVEHQGPNELNLTVELSFPLPKDYRDRLEYDIYSLFTEETGDLPLLVDFPDIKQAKAGLVRIGPKTGSTEECFGIVVQGKPETRNGLLRVDPGHYADRLLAFKKDFLSKLRSTAG